MARAGDRIGEFVLESEIGSGGFGTVWRARHHAWTGQVVAVKLPSEPEFVRHLQREGLSAAALNHPNIVRAIAFDPFAVPPYLVTEFVGGSSLRPLIVGRALRVDDAVAVLRQVLAGLAAAHGAGIVHGDLKPENILLDERAASSGFRAPGCVKIADFGFGRWGHERKARPAGSVVFSREAPVAGVGGAGSGAYMAPEQQAGGAVDGRTDLYALGVVLHEMLTGERPAGAEVPGALNPAVPGWLDEVYRRAYARLDWRFPSADAMLAAVERKSPGALKAEPGDVPLSARQVCPQCRGRVEAGDQFCIHCGVQLVRQIRRCEACGGYPAPNDAFCTCCGSRLAEAAEAI